MKYRQQLLAEGFAQGFAEGFAQGFAEGFAKGLEQGRREIAETLCEALVHRFGELPASVVARVEGASATELRSWFSRQFVADGFDDVFAPAGGAGDAG